MNPQSTALPAAPAQPPAASPAAPNIVANIPVHVPQAAPAPAPATEDDELDKIMHDVGQELKKADNQPKKHGLLDFLHKPKPLVKAPLPPARPLGAAVQAPTPPMPQVQPPTAAAKPKTHHSIPVFVIFVALCVTSFLVAAAIAAYRQT